MTTRLYYTDPYSREFDATITRVDGDGEHTGIRLDRTFFYPTSGGQPFDLGTLGGHSLIDVVDEDDGDVTHVVAGHSACRPGELIHGSIDWPRRFDHMQQHTGQHVLSAAFDRLFDVRTVGFHLGADMSTIDLAREMTARDLTTAETEANRVVWENRPVAIRFASAEEAAALPLRKESARAGTLRLIEVQDFDLSACGGTHVARTGEIGIITISTWERFKGGQRLTFHCGNRALTRLRSQRDTIAAASRLLSTAGHELPEAIERLQTDSKDQRRTLAALHVELTRYRAEELAASAEPADVGRLVLRAFDADATTLKAMATGVTSRSGFIAVLVSTTRPALVVVSRSTDVDRACDRVLVQLVKKFGGRGGGKPDLAQGGGLDGEASAILEEARQAILTNH